MRRDVYQAIADPTRRDIINLIAYRSMNLNSIADNFRMSRPAISQHIKILAECGLVQIRQEGRERFCEATLKPLGEVSDWIERYRRHWAEQYDALDDVLLRLQQEDARSAGAADGTGTIENRVMNLPPHVPLPSTRKKARKAVSDDVIRKDAKEGRRPKHKKHRKTEENDVPPEVLASMLAQKKGSKHKDGTSKSRKKEKKAKAGRTGKK